MDLGTHLTSARGIGVFDLGISKRNALNWQERSSGFLGGFLGFFAQERVAKCSLLTRG